MTEVLLVGGRAGVGKSSVVAELHGLLAAHDVRHAVVEGDALDLAHPPPWEHRLAERNLAAIWANYQELGHERLVYANTNCVVDPGVRSALGAGAHIVAVLLTASDDVVRDRLARREIGSGLEEHVERSRAAAVRLEAEAPPSVVRVPTDDRDVPSIARELAALTGWLAAGPPPGVAELLADVVRPVLRSLTRDGEVDAVSVARADGELWLVATLRGETFREPLWAPSDPPWSATAARDRLASDLQDFLAESGFAWGERRTGGGGGR